MKPGTLHAPPEPALETVSWTVTGTPRGFAPAPLHPLLLLWATRIENFWAYPLLKCKSAHAALFLVLAAVCLLRAWIGLSGFQVFTPDAFMPLDGAWRLLNGQRPHIDFYSFMGVLVYLPTVCGLLLSHGGAQGFAYGQALVGIAAGAWAWLLTRRRLPDVPAALFCLAIVLLAVAPYPLGHSPLFTSPATTYNRYGHVALALILLEGVAARLRPAKSHDFLGGLSTGLLLVTLFFLKITFFGAALFLIGAFAFCRPQTRLRWAGIGTGCLTLSIAVCAYFSFHLLPMLRDLVMVAGAKRVFPRAYELDSILTDDGLLLSFTALAALLLIVEKRYRSARSVAIAGAALCFAGTVLIFGSSEPHGAPLAVFLVLIALSRLSFRTSGLTHALRSGVLLWGSVFTLTALTPSLIGLGYATLLSAQATRHEIPMAGKPLASFIPTGTDANYRAFVNDGLALVKQHSKPSDTVMSLEFSNPFSYGLGLKPARGGTTTLDYLTTFNDTHRPTPEWLIGSARLVMVPKIYSHPSLENILRLYGPYLNQHFHAIGESRQWRVYRAN